MPITGKQLRLALQKMWPSARVICLLHWTEIWREVTRDVLCISVGAVCLWACHRLHASITVRKAYCSLSCCSAAHHPKIALWLVLLCILPLLCCSHRRSCLETIGRGHLEQGQLIFVQVGHGCIMWLLLTSDVTDKGCLILRTLIELDWCDNLQ